MEHEEEFEARQSVSSRGRDTRTQMMPGQNRETLNQPTERPTNQNLRNYNRPQEDEGEFGDGESSSVITEIVEEQVIEIDTENEEEMQQRDHQDGAINHYLDNIKQEDYVNRDEYKEYDDDRRHDGSNNNIEDQYQQDYDNEYDQDQDQNYQQMQYNQNMMANSPIVENPVEEEMTGSPQYYEAPRAINPKIRRKYEGQNLNDRSHLVWEQERLQKSRIERQMRKAHLWTKQVNFRDIDWHPTLNPKRAAFDLDKNPQRSNLWHMSNTSSVPLLTTVKGLKDKTAGKNQISEAFDSFTYKKLLNDKSTDFSIKKDRKLNNVFQQSSLQNMLAGQNGKVNVPPTHPSMRKENGRAFMTAMDNGRMGYSSDLNSLTTNFGSN